MISIRTQDVFHKIQLLRLLIKIADQSEISSFIYFKGGTCASMLGYLDRFSVDLDFDLKPNSNTIILKQKLQEIFTELNFQVNQQSKKTPVYLLKYQNPKGISRNTIKLSIIPSTSQYNQYESRLLPEINRILNCQTLETMVANKIVAPLDRFRKYHCVAGRDFYDIHHFFLQGYPYDLKIISDRTDLSLPEFFQKIHTFIEKKLTQKIIDEDLNTLLPETVFHKIRKNLKTELIMMINNEITKHQDPKWLGEYC